MRSFISRWVARLGVAEELQKYKYPFQLPSQFTFYENRYDMLLKFQLIRALCSREQEQMIQAKQFLDQFKLSNQKSKQIASLFLRRFHLLDIYIESTSSLVLCDKTILKVELAKLDLSLLKKIDTLNFYEKITMELS